MLLAAATLIGGAFLAGCGSSSKPTEHNASTATTATAHVIAIRGGVATPAGASKPTPASLAKLARIGKGSGVTPHFAGANNHAPLETQIQELDVDLNNFWSKVFAESNIQWPEAKEGFVGASAVKTECENTVAPTGPPSICNSTVYWPLPFMEQQVVPQGKGALGIDVAISWSFVVQNVLGFHQALEEKKVEQGEFAKQNLCLTGLYVRSVADRKLFEAGEEEAAIKFLAAGLDNLTEPGVNKHELGEAFLNGVRSGMASTCGIPSSSPTPTTTSEPEP
jgi:predicted metalloprotease